MLHTASIWLYQNNGKLELTMRSVLLVVCFLLLTSCSPIETGKSLIRPLIQSKSNCMGIIDWVDFVMINDIHYAVSREENSQPIRQGKKLGEVGHRVADSVTCTDYQTKNGDAAFLSEGTDI